MVDQLQPVAGQFVDRLDRQRVGQAGLALAGATHHLVGGRGHAGVEHQHLGNHFVERQRVPHGTGAGVGHAGHFQNGGNVRITALALTTVSHVEHDTRGSAGSGARRRRSP